MNDFAYFQNLNVVVCFVSKNASSFLKHYLSCLEQGKKFTAPSKNPHVPANNAFLTADSIGTERMSSLLVDAKVAKVVVGREPLSRLESAFKSRVKVHYQEPFDANKYEDWITLRQQIIGWKFGAHACQPIEAISQAISLEDLVGYVNRTPSWELDRHYIPQTYFAAVDEINYDLVGRVERLDQFLREFCELVGRPQLVVPDGYRLNSSGASSGPPALTESLRSKFFLRFEDDYKYFGYEHD